MSNLEGALSGGALVGSLNTVLGKDGKSAYEVAIQNGFDGTEEEWLASLKGDKGDAGNAGVYVGSGDMPADCNVQIDPNGDVLTMEELVNAVIAALPVYDGSADIEGGATLITFTIDGTEYQAEEGMTWTQWCESEYNTDGYSYDSDGVYQYNSAHETNCYIYDNDPGYQFTNGATIIQSSDAIVADYIYYVESSTGGTN